MNGLRIFFPLVCVWVLGVFCLAQETSPEPLDLEDEESVVLLRDVSVHIDDANRQTRVVHEMVRLLTEEAAEFAGEVSIPYNHYYEEPVLVEAATILPSGERISLEPEKAERLIPDDYAGYTMYSDAREFVFSMPRVVKGATLDYRVELRGKRTIIDGHVSGEHLLDDLSPVMTSRFSIVTDQPDSIHILATNLSDNVKRDGLSWSVTNLEGFRWEPAAPPVRQLRPRIAYSTLPDWKTLGDWYKALLADRLEPEPGVLAKAAELIKDLPPEQHLDRLYHFVQDDVRYVGIELGESAYKPHDSSECLRHTYGDCKDQSLLLVHLLSKAGIKAHLALARPRYQGQVDRTLPMPNAFSHAIVYVPGKDLWLDPTMSYLDLPAYPASLQGTAALVIDDDAGTLSDIPILSAEVERYTRESDIVLYPDGLTISTTVEKPRGNAAAGMRAEFADEEDWAKTMQENLKQYDPFIGVLSSGQTQARDRSLPFTNMVQLVREGEVEASEENLFTYSYDFSEAASELRVASMSIFQRLDDDQERRHDYEIREPSSFYERVRLHLPFGMEIERLPRAIKRSFATGKIEVRSTLLTADLAEAEDAGSARILQIECRVETTPTIIPADQVSRVSRLIERQLSTAELAFQIRDAAMEEMGRRPREVLDRVAAAVEQHPNDPVLRIRHGQLHVAASQYHRARAAYQQAIELEPRQFSAYSQLGDTYFNWTMDGFCIDHDAIEPVLLQALEHVPDRRYVMESLCNILLMGKDGEIGGEGSRIDRAIELLTEELEQDPDFQSGYLQLFSAYIETQAFEKADELALTASEKFPRSDTALFLNWRAAAFNGGIDLAMRQVTAAYADDPQSRDLELDEIYELLIKFQQFDAAAQLLEQRIRFVPPELRPQIEAQRNMVDTIANEDAPEPPEPGSPKAAVRTFMGHLIRNNTEAALAMLSDIGFPPEYFEALSSSIGNNPQVALFGPDLVEKLNGYAQTLDSEELADGSIAITVTPNADYEALLGKQELVFQVIKPDGEDDWRVLTMGTSQFRLKGIESRYGLQLLDQGKEEEAAAVFDRLLEDCGQLARLGRPDPLCQIRDLDFPDERQRYRAMAAVSQASSSEETLAVVRKYLPSLVEHHPENPLTIRTQLQLAQADKDVEAAGKALDIMVKQDPRMADQASMIKGLMMFEKDQFQETIDTLAPLLARYPNEARVRGMLARAYAHLDKADEAYELAKDPDGARRQGGILGFGLGGRPQNATGPTESEIEVAGILGDKVQLQEYLDKAAEDARYQPNPVSLWQAFNDVGDEEAAAEVALRNIQNSPLFERVHASQLHADGHIEDARVLYERAACEIDSPGTITSYLYYYSTLDPGRATELLRKTFRSAKEQMPYINIHIYLGEQFAGKPARPELLTEDTSIIKLSEWESALLDFILGKLSFDEAVAVAKKTKGDKQQDYLCELYCYQGQLHYLAGKKGKARKAFQACHDLNACNNIEHTIARIRLNQLDDEKKQSSVGP